MKIFGNLYDEDFVVGNYYSHLLQMVKDYDLEDYVSFEINVSFEKVINTMYLSKNYLHTMSGESFGISTVEAISAGLIPVVPAWEAIQNLFLININFVPLKKHQKLYHLQ